MANELLPGPPLTIRQQLMRLLAGTRRSARELAEEIGAPERQIEEHLAHVVRSLARDPSRRFRLEPSRCHDCGYIFRERTRLTIPSRCPRCRSEAIAPPRFGIEARAARGGVANGAPHRAQ
jgi:predicted Zn-ribbon and HTH transcriptional regulator